MPHPVLDCAGRHQVHDGSGEMASPPSAIRAMRLEIRKHDARHVYNCRVNRLSLLVGRRWLVFAIVAVPAAVLSLLWSPLGIDEAIWVTIARQWANGSQLYVEAIDNKSPLLYGIFWAVDTLPGSFLVVRSAAFGVLAGGVAVGVAAFSVTLGIDRHRAGLLGVVAGGAIALQSVFVITPELVAVAFVMAALGLLAGGRPLIGAVFGLGAAAVDVRFVLLLPALIYFASVVMSSRDRRRFTVVVAAMMAGGVLVLLAVPDLRYGLIELNIASRSGASGGFSQWPISIVRGLALLVLFQLFVFGVPRIRRPLTPISRTGWLLFVPAVIAASASAFPFDHYWSMVVPATPFFAATAVPLTVPPRRALQGALLISALVLPGLYVNERFSLRTTEIDAAAEVVDFLEGALGPGERYVHISRRPYVSEALPFSSALRSPIPAYLVWSTSRRTRHMQQLEEDLETVIVISDQGFLDRSDEAIAPSDRELFDLLDRARRERPCEIELESAVVYLPADRCPP